MQKQHVGLNKKTQARILSYYEGRKGKDSTKDARKIAEHVCIPRRKVMSFLEVERAHTYSPGSYL